MRHPTELIARLHEYCDCHAPRRVLCDTLDMIGKLTAERDAALADCQQWRIDYTELQLDHKAERDAVLARVRELSRQIGTEAIARMAAVHGEVQERALRAAVDAYDTARLAVHGQSSDIGGMSDVNKRAIAPMIQAAIAAYEAAMKGGTT